MWLNVIYIKCYFFSVQVIKAAVGQVNDIAQGNLAAADLSRAKWVFIIWVAWELECSTFYIVQNSCICFHVIINVFGLSRNQLTAEYLMSIESSEGLMEAIGSQALAEGTYHSPEAVTQKIDAVSSADVVNVSLLSQCQGSRMVTQEYHINRFNPG